MFRRKPRPVLELHIEDYPQPRGHLDQLLAEPEHAGDLLHSHFFAAAEEQVGIYLTDPDWRPLTDLVAEELEGHDPDTTVAFLWRAAALAPSAYHLSALLEQMKGRTLVPTILCYPGSWTESLNFMDLRDRAAPLGNYRVKIYGRQ